MRRGLLGRAYSRQAGERLSCSCAFYPLKYVSHSLPNTNTARIPAKSSTIKKYDHAVLPTNTLRTCKPHAHLHSRTLLRKWWRHHSRRYAIRRSRPPNLQIVDEHNPRRPRELQAELQSMADTGLRQLMGDFYALPARRQAEVVGRSEPLPIRGDVKYVDGDARRRVLLGRARPEDDLDHAGQSGCQVAEDEACGRRRSER